MDDGIRLDELTNVDMTNLQDGAVLKWDAARGVWRPDISSSVANRAYVDSAIEAALATLRVQ